MNPAVAYLVAARGTGGDNRTTKWSTNAVETRTGISRSRAQEAIKVLERAGILRRDPASKPSYPKYKLVPAHEIKGCEGFPPARLDAEHERVHAALGGGWAEVPKSIAARDSGGYQRWGTFYPGRVAESLVATGHAEAQPNGRHFRAIRYDADVAARPDWIWLPNALVDGATGEPPPVELIRQTGNPATLRLLVNLYGAHNLDEDGGIHFQRIRQSYTRHKVGEQGAFVVWGFVPGKMTAWGNASFVAPHLVAANDEAKREAAWGEFWQCWHRLGGLGLVECVGHLVHADTAEGEIMHPVALSGTGLDIERALARAAVLAGSALVTPGQMEWAKAQGVVVLAPVLRHIEGVQMVGIVRLRYRPRTNRTLAFMMRESEWRDILERLDRIAAGSPPLATSREDQGVSR